ncbi:PREDICTED: mavicyanin-like [Fragaria vesca subsp. vesca]|uniref:mavicyanin-like n=1 Tax=Fragaria vesca subsp. vesca TaxID=101020 RepID=UPI0002C2EE12|nr:PREDICTED: mavicyanin-like [Fragaria vesca subsp. vesca]
MARRTGGLFLVAYFVFPSMVLGYTEFVVGGDDGWKAGVVDYSAWASSFTFSAGDVLVFNYWDTTEYNVVVATGSDTFDNCVSTPNLGYYDSGHDVLELTGAGNYYFFCQGHCDYNDMKFMITVN